MGSDETLQRIFRVGGNWSLGLNSYSRLIVGKGERVGCGQEVVRPLHSFL